MSATPPLGWRPRDRAGERTRARLFEAAVAEFRRVGFDRASISRIASAASVSRPSFYFHFPTKEHVLLELQWNLEREVVGRMAGASTLAEALYAFVDAMIDAHTRLGGSGLLRDILSIYVRRPSEIDLDNQPLPLVRELHRRFVEAHRRGELRVGLEPGRATQLCLSSVFGYLTVEQGPPDERREDLRTLVSLYGNEACPT